VATPHHVGPARYFPENSAFTSVHEKFPHFSIGRQKRLPSAKGKLGKNQTYDVRNLIGAKQSVSKNRSGSVCHFGSATRKHQEK
jgi:hypothetical protein